MTSRAIEARGTRDEEDESDREADDEARRNREEPPPRRRRAPLDRLLPCGARRIDRERACDEAVHRLQFVLVARAGRAFAAVRVDVLAAGERLRAHATAEVEAIHHDSGSDVRPSSWRSLARARNSRVSTAPCCMPIIAAISFVE